MLPAETSASGSGAGFLEAIRQLVLDDQRLRNGICWSVFEC